MSDFSINDPNLSTETYGWDDHKFSTEQLLRILQKEDITSAVLPKDGGANHAQRRQDSIIAAMRSALKSANAKEEPQLFWKFFAALYGDRIQLNEWTGEVIKGRLQGATFIPQDFEPTTCVDELLADMENALDVVTGLNDTQLKRKLIGFFKHRRFNPVREELEGFNKQYPDDLPEWPKLAQVLFGLTDQLSQQMLEKWLVAAVSRAVTPGEKADNTLVLKGAQGIGKSTFFRILGGKYFLDLDSATESKEVKRQLAKSWIVELGEMEGITRKKEVEELKHFLTKIQDTDRGLYEKNHKDSPRHVVFGGSCNSDEILRDATGSRRFWVLDCGDRIVNTDFLRVNRGQILATAYRKFLNGFQHWADQEMTRQSEERNQQYQETNEFQDLVALLVTEFSASGAIAVKASDILTYGLNIPPERHKSNRHDRKVAQALEKLGLVRKQINRVWDWVTPDASKLRRVFPADITNALEKLRSCPKRSEGTLVVAPESPSADPVAPAVDLVTAIEPHPLPQDEPFVNTEDEPF
jgi:Virulence-associated protein E